MLSRAFRPIAAILAILLLTGAPTHAAPVLISEVIQVFGSYQNPSELRLRVPQTTNSVDNNERRSPVALAAQPSSAGDVVQIAGTSTGDVVTSASADTLLAGIAVSADSQAGIKVVDQGEVEGTICDCGEITVAGGGFPKWPLLFLAAIPFFLRDGCDHCETPTPLTTPTPPGAPEVPEPASVLLFGSGLAAFGAGLRRRYAKGKLVTRRQSTKES